MTATIEFGHKEFNIVMSGPFRTSFNKDKILFARSFLVNVLLQLPHLIRKIFATLGHVAKNDIGQHFVQDLVLKSQVEVFAENLFLTTHL